MDNGKFVTSEKGIARVKVYNGLGELESVVVAGPQNSLMLIQWGIDLAV